MQFRHLRYFVKIVEAGSFSRAAATIHVAQPALSQQIADLEDRMGVPLLQRTPRGVRPTPAGEVLYRGGGLWQEVDGPTGGSSGTLTAAWGSTVPGEFYVVGTTGRRAHLEVEFNADRRPAVARALVESGLGLLRLDRKTMELETIFQRLTHSGGDLSSRAPGSKGEAEA